MRPWRRAPAAVPGFPQITALAVTGESHVTASPDGPVRPAQQAGRLQRLARRARSPYILAHPAGGIPSPDWLHTALKRLDAAPDLACVSAGGGSTELRPTLSLDVGAMLARRTALLDSGGLAPRLQGQGDGLDLAWRLWAMGQRVVSLPGETGIGPVSPVCCTCSLYQAAWSWVQILVRNCEEEVLGSTVSSVLLRLLAAAGEAADRTAVLQAWPMVEKAPPAAIPAIQDITVLRRGSAAWHEPWYRVSRDAGELLVALHDITHLLPLAFEERKKVQARRRVGDAQIEVQLGRPPLEIIEAQMADLVRSLLRAALPGTPHRETGTVEGEWES
jgi:hypothetical protein